MWDFPSRLIHWIIAFGVTFDFFSVGGDPPHNIVGYIVAAAVVIRIFYGINKNFPRENKLASIVYWLIWLDVLALAVTGFLMGTDRFWGDQDLNDLHLMMSNVLIGLSLSHLLGIALHSIRFKKKTWMGMISGKRDV